MRLSLALGVPLHTLRAEMPAADVPLYRAYYLSHGFDVDRIEAGVANAGSVTANASGNMKRPVKPADLVPRFTAPKPQVQPWGQGIEQLRKMVDAGLFRTTRKGG